MRRLNNYEWAKFLDKNNIVPLGFINAIDMLAKRNNLDYYRNILEETMENCFYCGRKLGNIKVEVDHVIPWLYIHNDDLWNLVLACRSCNNNKRDRLPRRNYINKLIERNTDLIHNYPRLKKEMANYHIRNIEGLYAYAEINGFDVGWIPTS